MGGTFEHLLSRIGNETTDSKSKERLESFSMQDLDMDDALGVGRFRSEGSSDKT